MVIVRVLVRTVKATACSAGFRLPGLRFQPERAEPADVLLNSPLGPARNAMAWVKRVIDPELVLIDKSLAEGAVIPWSNNFYTYYNQIFGMAKQTAFPDKPLRN